MAQPSTKLTVLQALTFGARTAEDEADALSNYFVQTDQWKRIIRGDIDVIYGPKGAGKSAIYTLLEKSTESLFERNISTATAENPRGTTVFKDLVSAPPASERGFISLWKTYIASLICRRLQDYQINNEPAKKSNRHIN
jgi:hypothetical protein